MAPATSLVPTPARITRVVRELEDTVTFSLALEGAPMAFAPGQFTMLYLLGAGEVPISISGDPARPEELVHTIRAVGRVTRPLCALDVGASLGVRGPFGTAWPVDAACGKDVVFVAGGLGLAPLRPAILRVLARRADYGKVAILYGTRTPKDILFRAELERWRASLDLTVEVTVDRAGADWHGHVGVVPELVKALSLDSANAVAMVCGPEVMMRFTARALEARGMPLGAVYVSLERDMKCAVGFCGHCQLAGTFVCKDGPVFAYDRVAPLLAVREL
jgi:NAD(P)H-flavin reductase